MGVKKSNVEPT